MTDSAAPADTRFPPGTRVAELRCEAFRVPLPRPWGPDVPVVHLLVVELVTEDGATGIGFSWTPTIGAGAVRALIDGDIRDAVVAGPIHPGVVWDALWRHLHEAGGGGLTTMAMAAVDIALWDLRAKTAGMSLVDLLGRRHESCAVYGSGVNLHYPLDELRAQAQRWVAAGHPGVKVKVGKPELAEDLERVAAVREIIGPQRLLMVDGNQRWDLPTARRAIRALSAFDLCWVEEPLLADDVGAHVELRRAVDVPIAVGENRHTAQQFRDLLIAGACDVVQPNVVRVGGITPFLRIAELARTFSIATVPHLLPDLSGQLALCLPHPTLVEEVEEASFGALGALARPSGVTVRAGRLRADTGPGHGLDFARDRLAPLDGPSLPPEPARAPAPPGPDL